MRRITAIYALLTRIYQPLKTHVYYSHIAAAAESKHEKEIREIYLQVTFNCHLHNVTPLIQIIVSSQSCLSLIALGPLIYF